MPAIRPILSQRRFWAVAGRRGEYGPKRAVMLLSTALLGLPFSCLFAVQSWMPRSSESDHLSFAAGTCTDRDDEFQQPLRSTETDQG